MARIQNGDWRQARAKVAALARRRPESDPELIAARRDLRATRAEAYIRQLVDGAPKLSPEQLDRLRSLLPEAGGGDG